ncbi:hypothetical protein [Bacillus massilinigeriensis]|uniref:hypothetical protein n=1 Tax=Bacillus mediterraneensis TaxID=1805474 RepID=UPI0013564703|nr:hypothetical protein [Bacillus mediterraneensis]
MRRKWRKYGLALTASALLTLGMSGCNTDGDDDKEKPVLDDEFKKSDRNSNDTGK